LTVLRDLQDAKGTRALRREFRSVISLVVRRRSAASCSTFFGNSW